MKRAMTALVMLATLAVTNPVAAAPGGLKGKPGANTVFILDQEAPAQGDTITFTVETTAERPFSKVNCYRDGFLIYHSSAGHFDDYYLYFGEPSHLLASLNWVSGAADCTASLEYYAKGRMRTITTFDFHVTA